MSTVREQVLHEIAMVIRDAQDSGQGDGIAFARSRFPGTPDAVLYEAWVKVEGDRTDEWWTAVERTINGEVIRASIARIGGANVSGK